MTSEALAGRFTPLAPYAGRLAEGLDAAALEAVGLIGGGLPMSIAANNLGAALAAVDEALTLDPEEGTL